MNPPTATFQTTVREALKHYDEAAWLGAHSPLATPYFLGSRLAPAARPETAVGRGVALQEALYEAVLATWPGPAPQSRQALWAAVEAERMQLGNGGPRYLFQVLDLRYFRRYTPPRTPPVAVGAIYDLLAVSESAFYRHLDQAAAAVAAALLALIRPSLRLERPLLPAPLVGRDEMLAGLLAALRRGHSASISGVGGSGKSSLGTAVLTAWPPERAFWFTIRPGLNDDLGSLLFALGHFLHEQGRSGLWLQLLAAQGKIAGVEQALGLLREDLAGAPQPFLLCFDEVDLLQTQVRQARHGAHKQILEFLEGVRDLAPLLLIGQRALIDTAVHVALPPLTTGEVAALLARAQTQGDGLSAEAVREATGGNPRLVELYLALLQEEGSAMPLTLRRKPALQPLFSRLWKRLSREEKQVLAGLAVFRAAAPPELWTGDRGLADLRARHLVREDAFGGLALLPAFRELVYDELPAAGRRERHRAAALARARYGQYTAAAHHLIRAGEMETAVSLWFQVQDAEIAQGNAGAAYALFSNIPAGRLSGAPERQLRVIRNRLQLLAGELEAVLAGMESYSWQPEEELSATALEQWGDAQRLLGDLDGARVQYGAAIEVLGRLVGRIVDLQVKRGQTWGFAADLAAAEREALLAQHEVARYRGLLKMSRGRRRDALADFEEALALAEAAGHEGRAAEARYRLAYAYGDLGEMAAAEEHAAAAMAYYQRVGDRLRLEGLRAEMAGTYLNVGQYDKVIAPSEQALRYFEQIGHDHWPGIISNTLAEAYFETGDVARAEEHARRVIATENPPVQPYGMYTLGRVYAAQGDAARAEQVFRSGLQWAERIEDTFIAAYLQRVLGALLLAQGREAEGAAALREARRLFGELGLAGEVAQTEQLLIPGDSIP